MSNETDLTQPNYRWVVLSVWQLSNVVSWLIVSTFGILLPSISKDMELSHFQQGVLASIIVWGNLGLALPLSWFASRYGPKSLSTVTLALGTCLLFLQAWAPTFMVMLAARFAFGLTLITREPSRAMIAQQWFLKRDLVFVNSVATLIFNIGTSIGVAITPILFYMVAQDWRDTVNIFGISCAIFTVLWATLGRERHVPELTGDKHKSSVRRDALKHRDLWVAGIAYFGTCCSISSFMSFFPTMAEDVHGISLKWAGLIMAISVITAGISGLGTNYVLRSLGKEKLVLFCLGIVMAITYFCFAVIGNIPFLILISVINGVTWTYWPILITLPYQLPGIRSREVAVAMAFLFTCISIGSAVGPLATGIIQEFLNDIQLTLIVMGFTSFSLSLAAVSFKTGVVVKPR